MSAEHEPQTTRRSGAAIMMRAEAPLARSALLKLNNFVDYETGSFAGSSRDEIVTNDHADKNVTVPRM